MPKYDTSLTIGGDATGLQSVMGEVNRTIQKSVAEMQSHFKSIGTGWRSAMAGVAGLAGAGLAIKSLVTSAVDWAGATQKMATQLGTSTQQASIYKTALQHLGIEGEVLTTAADKLAQRLATNAGAFSDLGIRTKEANGQFRPMTSILQDTLDKLAGMTDPVQRNVEGLKLFGEGWAQVRPLLKLTSEEMSAAEERAQKLGLIVGPEGAARAKAYQQGLNDVALVTRSLSISMGNQLLPVVTQVTSAFAQAGPEIGETFGTALRWISEQVIEFGAAFSALGHRIGGLLAAAAAAAMGKFSEAKTILAEMGADIDAIYKKSALMVKELYKPPPLFKSSDSDPEPTRGTGSGDELGPIALTAERARVRSAEENAAMEAANRARQLEGQLAEEGLAQRLAMGQLEIAAAEETIRAKVALGTMTRQEELAALRELETQKYENERQALADRLQLVEGDRLARQQVLNDQAQAQQQHNLRLQQLDNEVLLDKNRVFGSIRQGFTSVLQTAFTGVQSVTDSLRSLMTSMLDAITNVFAQMMAEQLAFVAQSIALHKMGALKQIAIDARKAAAGAYQAVVGIPFVGPVLAPAAAAVAYGAVMAFGASAKQGYDIPAGVNPVTQLHAKEMVLPAELAESVRGMAGSGGRSGGGMIVNNHITAMDSRDITRVLNRHGAAPLKNALVNIARRQGYSLQGVFY